MNALKSLKSLFARRPGRPARIQEMRQENRDVICCGQVVTPSFIHSETAILESWECPHCGSAQTESFPKAFIGTNAEHKAAPGNQVIIRRDGSQRLYIQGNRANLPLAAR